MHRVQQIAVEQGIAGFQLHRLLVTRHRVVDPALILADRTQIVVGLGMIGRQANGTQQRGLGFIELSQVLLDDGHVVVSLAIIRFEFDGPRVGGGGPCSFPISQGVSKVAVSLGVIWFQLNCHGVFRDRGVEFLLVAEGVGQVAVSLWRLRAKLDGFLVRLHRLLQIPLFPQNDADIAVGGGMSGIDLNCPTKRRERFIKLTLAAQCVSQISVGLGEVGIQFNRPAIGADRFIEFALMRQGIAEICMCIGECRPKGGGSSDQLGGLIELARLLGDHAN